MSIQELRKKIGDELGFGSFLFPFDGSPSAYANLDPQEQADLTNAMGAYIRAHPDEFTAAQVSTAAGVRVDGPDTSSSVGVFVDEVAKQAESLNPLSEANRAWFTTALVGVALIGAAAYFFAKGGGSVRIGK